MTAAWCSLLLSFAAAAVIQVHCQSPEGLISINCGIEEGSSYDDLITNHNYVSDSHYIDIGINASISAAYATSAMELQERRFLNVRSFPDNNRHCYDITGWRWPMGSKYLLQATLMYGNYDGRNSRSIVFDLYLVVNVWKTINVTDTEATFWTEAMAMAMAMAESLSVCLGNTGKGTPFVSGMDVRPLRMAFTRG